MKIGRRRGLKSWLVEPYRQVKLGLMFLIVNLIFSVLILGTFGYYVYDMYTTVSTYFNLSHDQSVSMMSKFTVPIFVGLALMTLFVLTTLMISIKYTHQIYGPLVSIHRFLDAILEGRRPEQLQLRQSDQLKDLADKLNTIAEVSGDQRTSPLVPIYRFVDELLAGNKPKPLQLRDSDQMKTLCDKLNDLSEKL